MRSKLRGKRDGNQAEVVAAFEQLGCSVLDMADLGDDAPDLLVGAIGINHLVEVKCPTTAYGKKGLTGGQERFARDWRGGRVWVVSSALEAQTLVQNWRRR